MPQIIGRIPGKIVGFGFLLYILHLSSVITNEYVDLINAKYLLHTPSIAFLFPLLLLSGYLVRQGIEVLGRFAFVTMFYWVFIFMIYFFLTIPDMDIEFLRPIFENGYEPQLKGVFLTHGWSSQAIFLSFMLPYLNEEKRKRKVWSLIAIAFITFDYVAAIIVPKLVFGTILPDISYPVIQATEYIKIADFFERIDLILLADWIILIFIKISFFVFMLSLGLAQLFKLSDYRSLVFPVCILILVISLWSEIHYSEITFFLQSDYPYYSIVYQEAVPLLLLLIVWIQAKINHKASRGKSL